MATARSGGQIVVDQLVIHGVDLVFCVPGESYLAVLEALYDVRDRVRLVNARHEAGAANMAEAYGKLTAPTRSSSPRAAPSLPSRQPRSTGHRSQPDRLAGDPGEQPSAT